MKKKRWKRSKDLGPGRSMKMTSEKLEQTARD